MKAFTRRKFLKSILCGAGLTLVGNYSSLLFARPNANEKPDNTSNSTLLQQFDEARTLFRKKQLAEAEQLYKTILTELPAHISIYDCYKNLLSKQNRTDEILPYYKQAIDKYPGRADFCDRLAKIYREIATGNKKMEKRVCETENESDLIQLALEQYKQAIKQNPDKKFLYFGMLDALCARGENNKNSKKTKSRSLVPENDLPDMDDKERLLTEPYLQEWLLRKNPEQTANNKGRIITGYPMQIQQKIDKIVIKKRKILFDPDEIERRAQEMKSAIKKLNVQLHNYYSTQKNLPEMTALTKQILKDNPDETQVLGTARKHLKKAGRWDLQYDIYTERSQSFKDYCTQWGLAYACLQKKDINRAFQLFNILTTKSKTQSAVKTGMVYRGLCECSVAWGNYSQGKSQLLSAIKKTNGLGGVSTSLLIRYAECAYLSGNTDVAIDILRKKLDPFYMPVTSDPVLAYIAPDLSTSPELYYLHKLYGESKTVHKEEKISILCAIAKIKEKEKDRSGFNATIKEIDRLIPSYSFIKKHQI